MTRKLIVLLLVATLVGLAMPVFAQESTVKGTLSGTVYDTTGAVVPTAKVTLTGPTGSKTIESDTGGNFMFPGLTPGFFSVKVERQGFKISEVKAIEIATNKTTAIRVTLEPGAVSEIVEVSAPAVTVDTSSTAVGTNLTDSFYTAIPAPRNVTGLFYVAPGAVSGGNQILNGNPSISGGTGLENQYVADGVNITDGAFGGIGVFSRVYGSLSTGINLSFVQEVQVKSGGFEPQYGKSTGGIVQIVTKSGGNAYHGSVAGYIQPQDFEAGRYYSDLGLDPSMQRFNMQGQVNHQAAFDISGEIGGYVPGFKDKLFFFGSFNPSWTRDYVTFNPFHGLAVDPNAPVGGLGPGEIKATAYNYAAKVTWKINQNHTLEGSVFGDPTRTPLQNGAPGQLSTLSAISPTIFDQLAFGTRNVVVRYNGMLSPTWTVNASGSWSHNYLTDTPGDPNIFAVGGNIGCLLPNTDPNFRTGFCSNAAADGNGNGLTIGQVNPNPWNCPVGAPCLSTGAPNYGGFGYLENTEGNNYGFEIDTTKSFHFLGDHNLSFGYKLDRNFYDGRRERTGHYTPMPMNIWDGSVTDPLQIYGTDAALAAAQASPTGFDATFQLRATTNTSYPLYPMPDGSLVHVRLLQTRGEFGNPEFLTSGTYHALYGMDSWSPWKYLTINAGLRWEQQYIQGTMNPAIGRAPSYTWVGNWSPRIGVIVDPWGDRKTKVSVNFARYNYAIPLDMAIRSLSNEQDYIYSYYSPHWVGEGNPALANPASATAAICAAPCNQLVAFNPDGTLVDPTPDEAHLFQFAYGSAVIGLSSTTAIAPGTKMESLDEWVVGFEHDFGHGVIFSARYVDRRMKRIVEDMAGISPEAYNIGVTQNYFISNPSPKTDLFVNPQEYAYTPNPGATAVVDVGGVPTVVTTDGAPIQCIGFNGVGASFDITSPIPYFGAVTDTYNQPLASPAGSTNTSVCVAPQFNQNGVQNYVNNAAGEPGNPGDVGADGIPEGFAQPVRNYQAFELEVNKSFSRNWQLRSNYRLARLKGNYEGAFRNDNGQTDPSISSLFDFTTGLFNMLGDQFAIGYLNTDRRHVVNTYFSYMFDGSQGSLHFLKGLTLGTGVRVQTGAPINDLKAHPAYLNAGEIPVGGRGALGRFPTTGQIDIHADYALNVTEKSKLRFGLDMFNIANMKRITNIDQNEDRSFGVPNVDFKKVTGVYSGFQRPFYARMMVKWEF